MNLQAKYIIYCFLKRKSRANNFEKTIKKEQSNYASW